MSGSFPRVPLYDLLVQDKNRSKRWAMNVSSSTPIGNIDGLVNWRDQDETEVRAVVENGLQLLAGLDTQSPFEQACTSMCTRTCTIRHHLPEGTPGVAFGTLMFEGVTYFLGQSSFNLRS
jgi:hypothetical protein